MRLLVTLLIVHFTDYPISLSRPRHVDNMPLVDRWPMVFEKLDKLSTASNCRVSDAM